MALPRFYTHWLKHGFQPPAEATPLNCARCEMVRPRGLTRDLGPFQVSLKCCTFHPFLPAFSLGRILEAAKSDLELRERLEVYLSSSRLNALGAFPRSSKPTSICETGKIEATRCAFLTSDATCSIHDTRPSTCAGYVCRSSSGKEGFKEWVAWESSVASFEWTLAHLAAFECGYTLDDVEEEFKNLEAARNCFSKSYQAALAIRFDGPQ